MKTISAFATMANSDTNEGRGGEYPLAYFERRVDAELLAKDKTICSRYGVQGTGPLRTKEVTFKVFETVSEYRVQAAIDARARALSKLTYEEQEALGIK